MERAFCWDKFRKFSFIPQKIGKQNGPLVDAVGSGPAFGLLVLLCFTMDEQPFEIGHDCL